MLDFGDPAPWFIARSNVNPQFHFDTVAGRRVILSFVGSGQSPIGSALLREVEANAHHLDPRRLVFCSVSNDPADAAHIAAGSRHPAIIHFIDFAGQIAQGYGLVESASKGATGEVVSPFDVQPTTFVLDEGLRVLAAIPLDEDSGHHWQRVMEALHGQQDFASLGRTAPVLVLDRIFEPELCRELIRIYETQGGRESGFMRDVEGKTTAILDPGFKQRMDCEITDSTLIRGIHARMQRRLLPEIRKAFNFVVTRIERHIVGCYDGESGGHFRAHRDNTTLGTAHRRFAVSINLNSEEFEGGDLRFPEFGSRTYRPSTGGAVVFGCSLLHEATPVTRGRRYVFLPFLYDEAAAAVRERNRAHVSDEVIRLVPN